MRGWILTALILYGYTVQAQTIKGKLFGMGENGREILPGGLIHWLGTSTGTSVNENGVFELPLSNIKDRRIVAAMTGYTTDTITVGDKPYITIVLQRAANVLGTVTVSDRSSEQISAMEVGKTEIISQRELTKAACCDLAGCFGTQASVQPQTTNVITNAQELRILGLSGVYNQVLLDGMPMIQGLTYTYGVSTYPGSIVNNIYVSKGTSSVLQGYESISGQINLISRPPENTERLYLNGYMNSFGEKHVNANASFSAGRQKHWNSLLAVHMVQPANRTDRNEDGFMDLPLLTRYMGYNRWDYANEAVNGLSFQGAIRAVYESRTGGQMRYEPETDKGSHIVYGQQVQYMQQELYAKPRYRINDDHSLSLSVSGFVHNQDSWFGTTSYKGLQQNMYANLQHDWLWHDRHLLKYGLSYRYQELEETIRFTDTTLLRTYAGDYITQLRVPGAFAENTFHWKDDKVVLITGVRVDKHQTWGVYVTPRALVKYQAGDHHTLRISAGRGWRQVNLFSEQLNLLISSRDIVFAGPLRPEAAWNWGLSHTYRFTAGSTSGTISGDFYSTHFTNQFFPDYDSDPTRAIINNFTGTSWSGGAQADVSLTFFGRLDVRAAYNYLDVYRVIKAEKVRLPFTPRNRLMAAVSYRTANKKWQADCNMHWFDRMRLPDTRSNPEPYARPLYSVPWYTVNVQLTFRWRKLDIYGGCENLANYTQPDPIISAADPFGKYFDISSVWGPTRGRELYIGVRYSIK